MTMYGEFKGNANHPDKGLKWLFTIAVFLASFHTYYFESLLSGASYSNYAHFLPFHFPFLN